MTRVVKNKRKKTKQRSERYKFGRMQIEIQYLAIRMNLFGENKPKGDANCRLDVIWTFQLECGDTRTVRGTTRCSTYLAIFVHRQAAFQSNLYTLVPAAHPFLVPLKEGENEEKKWKNCSKLASSFQKTIAGLVHARSSVHTSQWLHVR